MDIKTKPKKIMSIIRLSFLFIIFLAVIYYAFGEKINKRLGNIAQSHVFDRAGIISSSDLPKFEWLLDLIEKESDLDIKFLFLKTIGTATIEEVAVEKMDEYGIGRHGREERGVLFLYVMDKKKLRIEVGYGLETYFPDIFVGYLIRNQADAFFKASNPNLGLRLLIRILHHRIREAVLNKDYDPSILERGIRLSHLSGGAGAAAEVGANNQGQIFKRDQYDEERKERLVATDTVVGTFDNYIDWLYGRKFDPNVDLFTKDSFSVLNRFPMTPAYFDYILMLYAGKQYKIVKHGDLAILYFTDDPLASPLFFNRTEGKWRLNITAEIRNSRNHVGGVYSWSYNPDSRDEFARTFKNILVNIRGYYRFQDGDNRKLPVKVDVQKKS
ncbi:MAG: TPM domain-containing protein [Proteobacteria bacterium]|nr:TPM domain-containing protein [Pseudomonadota bacterium]